MTDTPDDRLAATPADRPAATPADPTEPLPGHLARPSSRPDVEMAWFDGEAVLFDPATRQLHTLNGSAAAVWLCADGTQDVTAMAAELADTFGVQVDTLIPDVVRALRSLDELGLLVGSPLPPVVEEVEVSAEGDGSDQADVLLPPPYG